MDKQANVASTEPRRGRIALFAVALFAVVLGVYARADALDHKLFWQDEAFAMLRVTGHEQTQLDRLFDGRIHASSELRAVVRIDPHNGPAATLASLRDEPQRGPLFYLIARLWAGAFGDGVAPMRALSACIGITCIVFAFFLGRRFGAGDAGGAVLAALVAIAPIEVQFSQQVREYEALAACTFASAWLLLRALEQTSVARFACYGTSVLVGLATSPIFLGVIFAQGIVAAVAARRSGSRTILGWLAAVAVAALILAPWFFVGAAAAGSHTSDLAWLVGNYTPRSFALKWAFNCGAVFFDTEFAHRREAIVLVPIIAIECVAFAWAWRRGDPTPRTLALATTLGTSLPLVALDLARDAHFESVTRYQMATWAGVDMLVALLIVRGYAASSLARVAAVLCFAFLACCGAYSAIADRSYVVWWQNNEHLNERSVGEAIAAGPRPAVVIASGDDAAAPYALVLSRYVPADVSFLLFAGAVRALPHARAVYLFAPSRALLVAAERDAPHAVLRDVSPPMGLDIPDLRAPHEAQADVALRADNALWEVVPSSR